MQIDEPPLQPVASRLTLSQRLDPPTGARAGEPVIRTLTLTLEGGDGNRLTLSRVLGSTTLPAGVQARPDGEQQQERYLAEGTLRFEREWRQALTVDEPGDYLLPAIELAWFNTQHKRIEYARLPATPLHITAGVQGQPAQDGPNDESLLWVIWLCCCGPAGATGRAGTPFTACSGRCIGPMPSRSGPACWRGPACAGHCPIFVSTPCPVAAIPPLRPTSPPWSEPVLPPSPPLTIVGTTGAALPRPYAAMKLLR